MGAIAQILLGTAMLGASTVVHVTAVANCVPMLVWLSRQMSANQRPRLRLIAFVLTSAFALVLAHTLQVWAWSVVFLLIADIPDLATSFYFATVTYTTLGYGDIVLGADARIAATFCAVTGLLTFGITTAFLFGVLTHVLPKELRRGAKLSDRDLT